jgi:hypothetical protein
VILGHKKKISPGSPWGSECHRVGAAPGQKGLWRTQLRWLRVLPTSSGSVQHLACTASKARGTPATEFEVTSDSTSDYDIVVTITCEIARRCRMRAFPWIIHKRATNSQSTCIDEVDCVVLPHLDATHLFLCTTRWNILSTKRLKICSAELLVARSLQNSMYYFLQSLT